MLRLPRLGSKYYDDQINKDDMTGFNNQAYKPLVEDLLNDAFYLEARSHRGTIATIRQYTEVIVRKYLNLSHKECVTLGRGKMITQIERLSSNNPLIMKSLKDINSIGSTCTHTQGLRQITKKDVENCIQSLFNLYAYLFISYFNKYRFGINDSLLRPFSILPPIIRYIVLKELFQNDKENVAIIDRLSMVMIKAFNRNKTIAWLDDQKDLLSNVSFFTPEAALDLKNQVGEYMAQSIIDETPNMYDYCLGKVDPISSQIQKGGRLYYDFESALPHYREYGIVEGESDGTSDFNDLMEFVYLGRKPRINEEIIKEIEK